MLRTTDSQARFDDIKVNGTMLTYLHSDHLGSNSLMSKNNGTMVLGSQTFYLPFGDYRGTTPNQTLTDRGYTGHKENMELGLIYMNARYYLPGLARFASADTIVPDPANPQSHNRYGYVLNNPLRFVDPSGHCAEEGDEECWAFAEQISQQYGITLEFLGLMNLGQIRFFVQGLEQTRGVNSGIPEQIAANLNSLDEYFTDEFKAILDSSNWDVLGIRLEAGVGAILGIQGDIDIVFNFQSWELSIFITPGVQAGAIAGASAGVGAYFGFNAPNNDAFWGLGWGATASYASGPGGALQYNDSFGAWSIVLGFQGGAELDLSLGIGYTFEIVRYHSNPDGTPGTTIWFPQWFYWQGWSYD